MDYNSNYGTPDGSYSYNYLVNLANQVGWNNLWSVLASSNQSGANLPSDTDLNRVGEILLSQGNDLGFSKVYGDKKNNLALLQKEASSSSGVQKLWLDRQIKFLQDNPTQRTDSGIITMNALSLNNMNNQLLRDTLRANNPNWTDAQLDEVIRGEEMSASGQTYWGNVPPYVKGTVPTPEQKAVRGPDGLSAVGPEGLALANPNHPTGEVYDPVGGMYIELSPSSPYYWTQNPQMLEAWSKGANGGKPAGWTAYPAAPATAIPTGFRSYQAGDPNPNTGTPLSQTQADILNKQGVTYNPVNQTSSTTPINNGADIKPAGAGTTSSGSATPITGTSTTSSGQTTGTTTTGASSLTNSGDMSAAMSVLNNYFNSGEIDFGTYQFFKEAINAWDPNSEVNYANILNTFDNIVKKTVDPYFAEQSRMYIDEVQRNIKYLNQQKALEEEGNKQALDTQKRNIQEDLAARGMTFTGEAVRKLGPESAFAVPGTPQASMAAMPVQHALPDGTFAQGEFQQAAKTATSSTALRYQQQLEKIARDAEAQLGTTKGAPLVPEVSALGGITGEMTNQASQAKANTLTGLYNQELQNVEARKPSDIISST